MSEEMRAVCPSCSSITLKGRVDPKFYYNPAKSLGYCHHCGFTGSLNDEELENLNVVSLVKRDSFNPEVFNELEPLSDEARRFLEKRFPGVEADSLEPFQLRYSPDKHAIAIACYSQNGKQIQGIKYRFIAESGDLRYIAEPGSQFGGYWLEGSSHKLLIVEGEFDAVAAKLLGFDGTVLALQTNKLSLDSLRAIQTFRHVFLALDNDEAGREGKSEIQKLQPGSITIQLPDEVKDLNELLQVKGLDAARSFLKASTRTSIEQATQHLSDTLPELVAFLSDARNTQGISSGFKALDKLLGGGLRPNEMTVINAFAKTGKTSFINNLAHNLACLDKKIAIASFEMDPAKMLYPSLLSIAGQTNLRSIRDYDVLHDSVHLIAKECSYLSNIITFKKFGITPWSDLEEWATIMKEQYQIEFLVLDHAGFLVEKMTDAEENQTLAKNIKKLTLTLGIHIFVVVQAPKTKDGLSIQTSYGGLAWGMNADNFIILERSKDDESELRVRLEAARYPGANPSSTPALLYYDRETCSLME